MFQWTIILFLTIGALNLFATTFIPLTIDKQIESASGAADVELISKKSIKDISGHIYTDYEFHVLSMINFTASDFDQGKLLIHLPGGTLDGLTTLVDGSPQFEIGKRCFILLKKVDSKIYLSNFTLGVYDYSFINGQNYLINEVFPNYPKVGKISRVEMIKKMNSIWKISFEENKKLNLINADQRLVYNNQNTLNKITFQKRKPAEAVDKKFDLREILIFLFALIGIVFSLFLLKSNKNEK